MSMKAHVITQDTLQDLRVNYEAYKNHYYRCDHEWFDAYFNQEGKTLETNIEFEMPELSFDPDYALSDRINVKQIYHALQHLSATQATQERVWSGLAHLQFREFIFYRLREELANKKDDRINTALFFKNGNKRSLFVHILARLWWVGYMTYDSDHRDNPFWLTDFFCQKDFSARAVVFFSSNFTSNRVITRGILRALIRLEEQGVKITRDYFVQSTKYLNVVGGAMILDMLTVDEVEEMVTKRLKKVFNLQDTELLLK